MIKHLANNNTVIGKKEKMVFNLIRRYKKSSRKELLNYSKLKIATLYRTIDNLLKKKLIKVSGTISASNGGRAIELFSINENTNYVVVIGLFRDYFKIAITNLEGSILKSYKEEITKEVTPEKFVELSYAYYIDMLKQLNIEEEIIIGIGLGCVGPIDIQDGKMLNPYNFRGSNWKNVPIVQILTDKFHKKVIIDNIARASVGGQYWLEFINKYNTMAYVTIGKGIGVGLMSNGYVVRGKSDIIQGLGHMVVDIDGRKCQCGNYGCVEAYSSLTSIKEQIRSEIKKGRESSLDIDSFTIEDVDKAYKDEDYVVKNVVYDAANIFSTGIVNFINIVELEVIVIGGELIQRCPSFCDITLELINKKIKSDVKVVLINNEEDSVLSGMAMYVLDYYLS